MQKYDLIVIGAGPGGYVAAIKAAQLGLSIAVIERESPGGVCLNWGCIPTKALLNSAALYRKIQHADEWGLQAENVGFDLAAIVQRSREISQRLTRGVGFLFKKNSIELIQGSAVFTGPNTLLVQNADQQTALEATNIIIASGAQPVDFPFARFNGETVISYREALIPEQLPTSLIIIGGGPIGLEFATFYATFGTEVTLFEMLDRIAPGTDPEASRLLALSLRKLGVKIQTGTQVEQIKIGDGLVSCSFNHREQLQKVTADKMLLATGFRGNFADLQLELAGVESAGPIIPVDENLRTNVSHIYAIGDVKGAPGLAHTASAEGVNAVLHLAGKSGGFRRDLFPATIYTTPEYAWIGMTEEQAQGDGFEVKVGKFPFAASGRAQTSGATTGFVKTIHDAVTGNLLGAHIVGENASELIHEFVITMQGDPDCTILLSAIHGHPTLAESCHEAVGAAFGQSIHL
ncbi:MAG: dihydrolipoyl dehydrogenase [Candidatus Delongbacteria bacterium]|nr:dihydrolipoyl dehydrogenase [Candidatus Delongbacteria bacterium]